MINPQIPLMAQGVAMPDPMAALARVAGLKAQQTQQQIAQSQLQDAELRREASARALAQSDAVKAALAESGGDIEKAIPKIMAISPETGIALSKATDEQKAAHLKLLVGRFDVAGRLVRSMTPENFSTLKAEVAKQVGDDLAAQLGDTYNPAVIQQAITWGEDARDAAAREHDKVIAGLTKDARDETARANKARETSDAAHLAETTRHNKALENRESARDAADRRAIENRKGMVERWKQGQLTALEKRFASPLKDGMGLPVLDQQGKPVPSMTVEQLTAEKLRIENSYRDQLGLEPLAELPESWNAAPAKTDAKAATPAPAPAAKPATGKPAKAPAVGDPVMYQGKKYRVKGIDGGNAILEEWRD